MAPAVLWAWEVHPLRMAELIAHEVEVALASKALHEEPDHLMEGQAPINGHGVVRILEDAHIRVHGSIHKPEGKGLVTHNGLVVRLSIGNDLLHVPSIRQRVANVAHVPTIVTHFLQELDEHVWNGHRQTIVEAKATILNREADRRHAADVLCNGDSAGHYCVDKVVRQHEVNVAVDVCVWPEVLVVSTGVAFANAVRMVEH
mmetsp:Transcript_62153/g.116263  ORF Transcript_62153/g.116263 Transcript_62153/m.116263 type:complete len:202 (+) Transcript_62153:1080-1685(+)